MSFIPARKSLQVWRGQVFHYRFEWLVKTGQETRPQDTTGWTATWVITPMGSETPWKTLHYPPGEILPTAITLSGETGFVDLVIGEEDVESITWKQAVFEIKVVDPVTKETRKLLTGRLNPATL